LTTQWIDDDLAFIRRRYNRVAGVIPVFDWLFCHPLALRKTAVDRLDLKPGDRALEIGCGHGRNLDYLQAAVGPTGHVYGVDLSEGMLRKSQQRRERFGWTNVTLTHSDAATYVAPTPLDGVLFGFSYATMPHHLAVLQHAWKQLRPGGRLVILDAKPPPGRMGRIVLPFGIWLMKRTLLGNPLIRPWEDLAALTDEIEIENFRFGAHYVCRGVKPLQPAEADRTSALRTTAQVAAE
jgi:demethylmenaquinone methyltransferase/2-methoxy-6-polyprenyl-1,4-benzoquinol methylase